MNQQQKRYDLFSPPLLCSSHIWEFAVHVLGWFIRAWLSLLWTPSELLGQVANFIRSITNYLLKFLLASKKRGCFFAEHNQLTSEFYLSMVVISVGGSIIATHSLTLSLFYLAHIYLSGQIWLHSHFRIHNVHKRMVRIHKRKKTDCLQSELFWIIPVQDWSKTDPANAVFSLRTLNCSNVIHIDFLLVKKSKIDAAFLIINE